MPRLPFSVLLWCVVIFSCASQAFTQQSGDDAERLRFSGRWLYDSKRSTTKGNLKELYSDQSLTISQNSPMVEIKKVQTKDGQIKDATVLLYTDKRGETNNPFPFNEKQQLASVTEWKGPKLIRVSVGEIPYRNAKLKIYIRETFSLSKDGNTLTISEETFTDSPTIFFPDKTKKVYQRN